MRNLGEDCHYLYRETFLRESYDRFREYSSGGIVSVEKSGKITLDSIRFDSAPAQKRAEKQLDKVISHINF